MQCSAQHQAVRHHTKSTDGAARHAGCSGPMRPCVTARRRRQGSVGQVREYTGPAMPQHTYTQRAHNTHSPARLPVPVGRHPGLLPFGNSAFGTPHHTTPHHTTPHHTTPHHTTPHHTTPHHTTPHPEYSPALPMGWVPGAKPRTTGPGHHPMGGVLTVSGVRTPQCQTPAPGIPRPPSTGRLGIGNGQRPLARTAGTAAPSSPHTGRRPPPTQGSPQRPPPPRALSAAPPPTAAPPSLPPSRADPHPPSRRSGGRRRGSPPEVGPCHQRRGQVCLRVAVAIW